MADKKEVKKVPATRKTIALKKTAIKKPVKIQSAEPVLVEKVEKEKEVKLDMSPSDSKVHRSVDRGSLFLGASLLTIGAVWMLSHFLRIPLAAYLWPFAIILPGVFLFIASLNMRSSSGEAMSVVASIITATGLLLFFQMVTHTWASWAYAWAFIAPASIGLGQMLFGRIKGNETLLKNGWQVARVGLIFFAVGFVFFELIIGLHGFGLARFGLPVLPVIIIAVGAFILVRALTRRS
jgi:hypothetical protein